MQKLNYDSAYYCMQSKIVRWNKKDTSRLFYVYKLTKFKAYADYGAETTATEIITEKEDHPYNFDLNLLGQYFNLYFRL
jgi:hypothetical protein